ncbi:MULTISPECIES: S8 family serine peptidase [Actinosynnema]|uniref:S8 family serine peptidase n=1 Tax=Actinosynnema TaxID=40566 RepID=UPI0020A40267|nr:S8 family serine peptidase [Actinosynnema pretiosum]MCP2093393.1 Serine protease, subtilisin family [Actinosynnema pretiosum]
MGLRRREHAALAVAAVTATLIAAPVALGAPSGAPEAGGAAGEVTLVTGDRVRLVGDRVQGLIPGPGREKIGVERFQQDGRVHVVPADAASAVASGKLDLRLFDVTALVEAGYDDARRDSVPLIVTHRDGGSAAGRASGLRVTEDLPEVRSFAASSPKAGAGGVFASLLADPAVEKVWLDGLRKPALDRSTAQIGAPAAWQAGHTGAGVNVAVLDSGVDGAHPDLAGRVSAEANFTDDPDATDLVGHGTHVAASIASTDERYRGVAPDARILAGKVCTTRGCPESAILAGMRWAVDQGADVVNLSLGGEDTPEDDPLEQAVDALSAGDGPLFVISAGNNYSDGTVGSPGSAASALTVGAVDRNDALARFSSRGPLPDGSVKPDLTAPGVDVVAARSGSGAIGTPVGQDHVALSGTSMAAPHVAGAAALLKQQHPEWSGQRIKAALMASAKRNPALTPYQQGVGRVDLAAALTADVTAEPASVALGSQAWPHDDDVPVTREITYRNTGADPVTLGLAVETTAPAGMFTVSPAQLTIPSGGTGTATVTGDSRVGAADGSFSAWVVAGTSLRVPVGLHRAPELYDVTFESLGLDGAQHTEGSLLIISLSGGASEYRTLSEPATVALRPGHYLVGTTFHSPDRSAVIGAVVRPELEVTGPATVTADLRTAPVVDVDLPDPSARQGYVFATTNREHDGRRFEHGTMTDAQGLRFAQVGQAPPEGSLKTHLQFQYDADPVDDAAVHYRLAWVEDGMVDAVDRTFTAQDLAEVRTDFGVVPDGVEFLHGGWAYVGDLQNGAVLDRVPPSGRVINRVNTEARWQWDHTRGEWGSEGDYRSDLRDYLPGQVYRERMGTPVNGPSARASATRTGDSIDVAAPLFDDSEGNRGQTQHKTARTALHRDGVLVGETTQPGYGWFDVAPGEAEFRLEASYERDSVLEFGRAVSATWTFRSDTATAPVELPLHVVRFAPELDRSGNAPAGAFPVPLEATGPFTTTTVSASFDDGATWTAVPVADGVATVPNPASGWVSLRVAAEAADGTAFGQTAIRAYRIG